MYHLCVDENCFPCVKHISAAANKKICRPIFYKHKLNLGVPVPVNTVQVKEPYILIIISKGIFLTAVTYGFTKSFVSDDLCVAVV